MTILFNKTSIYLIYQRVILFSFFVSFFVSISPLLHSRRVLQLLSFCEIYASLISDVKKKNRIDVLIGEHNLGRYSPSDPHIINFWSFTPLFHRENALEISHFHIYLSQFPKKFQFKSKFFEIFFPFFFNTLSYNYDPTTSNF